MRKAKIPTQILGQRKSIDQAELSNTQ